MHLKTQRNAGKAAHDIIHASLPDLADALLQSPSLQKFPAKSFLCVPRVRFDLTMTYLMRGRFGKLLHSGEVVDFLLYSMGLRRLASKHSFALKFMIMGILAWS
eukprot:2314537-Pyramimonas_sp.AAC.1